MSEFGKDCEADAVEFTIEGASIRKQEEEEELGIRKKNQRETGLFALDTILGEAKQNSNEWWSSL